MSEARNPGVIADNLRQMERLAKLGWYHSIELPGGEVIEGHQSIEQLRRRVRQFPIPEDLRGKRVLDIGAWDGWFSFEMERRGADVLALDSARNTRLMEARRLLGSRIEYRIGDICRLTWRDLGKFDIVLFLGVLYHVKHPILALENVCGMTREMACIESFVSDSDPNGIPAMEFYETTELRGQPDNWVGPNASCLLAFCRAAGFARVNFEGALAERAHVTAYRHWNAPMGTLPAPAVLCVENSATKDHTFSSVGDDYITIYFTSGEPALDCDKVQATIGGYASRPLYVAASGGGWQATAKIPPGLASGWHDVTLRTTNSSYSSPLRIGLDQPRVRAGADASLRITRVTDGKTFEDDRVRAGAESAVSVWCTGLDAATELTQVRLRLNGTDLPAIWIATSEGGSPRQINALLPSGLAAGAAQISVVHDAAESIPTAIEIY